MIAGLEFVRSWRFWTELVVVTSAVNFGSAGVHIALNLYLPILAVEPRELYSELGGFAVAMLALSLYFFVYQRNNKEIPYPEKHESWLMLVSGFAAVSISLITWALVRWWILDPIVPNAPGGSRTSMGGILAMFFGWWIAKKEWAAMTGSSSDADISVTPESP